MLGTINTFVGMSLGQLPLLPVAFQQLIADKNESKV
jgi:hypothetical protein